MSVITQYDNVLDAISAALPQGKEIYQLSEPVFDGNEISYLTDCVESGWVSSVGAYVSKFESMIADYTGAKYAIATSSGTSALHAMLVVAGIGKDDEVLVPAISFVATANAVAYCGAVPHFVDCDEKTLGVDPFRLNEYLQSVLVVSGGKSVNKQTGREVKGLVAVHAFGHPVDLDEIADVCQRFNLMLFEDAAEALGSFYKGRHVGNYGSMSALSFNGNKIITTGGGGAIICNEEGLARKLRHITTTARIQHAWRFEHDEVGFNYRMPNINAALGCAQLENLEKKLALRREQATRYQNHLKEIKAIRFIEEPDYATSNYWLSSIALLGGVESTQNDFIEAGRSRGLMLRPVWRLLNKLPMYSESPVMDLHISEKLEYELVNLPSS